MPSPVEICNQILTPELRRELQAAHHPVPKRLDEFIQGQQQPIEWEKVNTVIVSGYSLYDDEKHGLIFPPVNPSDYDQLVAGYQRFPAIGAIWNRGFRGTLAITGGCQRDRKGRIVSRAEEAGRRLIKEYDIPPEHVSTIGTEGQGHTHGNIKNVVDYFADIEKETKKPITEFILFLKGWHVPRGTLLYSAEPKLRNRDIIPVAVDDLAQYFSEDDERLVHYEQSLSVDKMPGLQKRIKSEQEGIRAKLIRNNYQPRSY